MYQGKNVKAKPQKPAPRWVSFFRDAFAGKHLLKSWKFWMPWLLIIMMDMLIIIANEQSINKKEAEVKKELKVQKSLLRKLKQNNESVYSNKKDEFRNQAESLGYEPIKEYNYYQVEP